MNLDTYQALARKTAIYPNMGDNLSYPALGLTGEAGEVAERVKKVIRDQQGKLTDKIRMDIALELGDVLWYVSALAAEIGYNLDDVGELNLQKLKSRKDRDKIHGDGDYR